MTLPDAKVATLAEPDYVSRVRREAAQAKLVALGRSHMPAPPHSSPILVCVLKNEIDRLDDFLRHYRERGVRRFCFIDNASTDGTTGFLARQADVDLLQETAPFNATRKQGWIMRAMQGYGAGRWFLCVDADEHIVFDGDEERSFEDLAREMEARNVRRVRGLLIDMFAEAPLQKSRFSRGDRLVDTYSFYDGEGYAESRHKDVMSVRGGPRKRMLGHLDPKFNPELTKYPLFKLGQQDIMASPHHLWPYEDNFASPRHLGILHFKFLPSFPDKVRAAVATRAYWDESLEYRCYEAVLQRNPDIAAHTAASRRYGGPVKLASDGLIARMDWEHPVGAAGRMLATARHHRARLAASAAPPTESAVAGWAAQEFRPAAPPMTAIRVLEVPAPAPVTPAASTAPAGLSVVVNELRVVAPNYRHIDMTVNNLPLPAGGTGTARFKLGLSGIAPRLEFRRRADWPLFARAWPGTEEDRWGPVFRVGPGGPRALVMSRISDEADRAALGAVIDELPQIVAAALPQLKLTMEDVVLFSRAARELPAALA
ncbi:glycosyltransferase family 2 protein [Falsiroseomonas sp. E2-1-a20]|uniref:glycosyltransferase family 2 protein n=1 Tax=Falsiroseomonas sp. E2-1-a20 TaxID=3239300 RepID=UPI003F2CAD77